jgi:hypothetical protein
LPGAHLTRPHKDGDGFTRAQRFFQSWTPSRARREMSAVEKWLEIFIAQLPRNVFHDVMIN